MRWLHVMTVENLLSHELIKDWLTFHALYICIQLYCHKQKQKQKLLYLKDIDMSILPIEKFIILTEDVAKLTKISMGKKENLVKFIWFVKYLFNVFAADLNLRENVFRSTFRHLFYYGGLIPCIVTMSISSSGQHPDSPLFYTGMVLKTALIGWFDV